MDCRERTLFGKWNLKKQMKTALSLWWETKPLILTFFAGLSPSGTTRARGSHKFILYFLSFRFVFSSAIYRMTNNAYTYGQQVESSSELTQMWLQNVLRHNSRTIHCEGLYRTPNTRRNEKSRKNNEMKMSSTGSRLLKIQFNWNQSNDIDEKRSKFVVRNVAQLLLTSISAKFSEPEYRFEPKVIDFSCLVRSSDKTMSRCPDGGFFSGQSSGLKN